MQEIGNGTFNYSALSEIMPMIYKRFTEKSAEEWRQIYKALQLLEFLIKNGSERVVDDARSHLSLLKMLRQFHYVDSNGKDQGINVRNRAKELAELLGDVERIRSERKKARTTRNKYTGSEGGMGLGGGMSNGGRYGGYGSESAGPGGYGGYSGGVYGDGGGFGGRTATDEYDAGESRRDRFDEYNEYDDGGAQAPSAARRSNKTTSAAKAEPPKPKEPEVDLFDFGDDDVLTSSAPVASASGASPATASNGAADAFGLMQSGGGDDDFDDFQAAPSSAAAPVSTTQKPANGSSVMSPIPPPGMAQTSRPTSTVNYSAFKSPPPPASVTSPVSPAAAPQMGHQSKPSGYQPQGPNYFGSISMGGAANSGASTPAGIMSPTSTGTASAQAKKPAASGDPFAALAMGGGSKKASQKGPSMADMAKQQASQGIWGPSAPATQGGSSGGNLI